MLSDRDRAVLEFELLPGPHRGGKEATIFETFQFSAARYYQLLGRVLDDPEAVKAFPLDVARLRRIRARRIAARAAGSFERTG